MQTIWKGSVSFGLVSIPVKLYSATEERSVSFRQVHAEDGGRIRYRRVCEIDGAEVAYRDIAKGYDLADGDMVVLTDEDFANLPLTTSRTVDVLQFVPVEQVDPVYVNRSYYLQAEGAGLKPYVLLRDALERSGKAALVKVALRNREALAVLRPRGAVLMMQTILWPDEVRDPAAVAPEGDVEVRSQEAAMAQAYIETLSGDLELADYTDEYRTALEELVAAKAAGRELAPAEQRPDIGVVVDLMEALRQSVEAARGAADAGQGGGSQAGGSQAGGSQAGGGRGSGTKARGRQPRGGRGSETGASRGTRAAAGEAGAAASPTAAKAARSTAGTTGTRAGGRARSTGKEPAVPVEAAPSPPVKRAPAAKKTTAGKKPATGAKPATVGKIAAGKSSAAKAAGADAAAARSTATSAVAPRRARKSA